MTDVLAFFAALALAACVASEPAAPPHGATVTRADNVVAIVHYAAGDVAYLPSEAP